MTPHDRELLERIDRRGRIHSVVLFVVVLLIGVLASAVFGQSSASYAAARADRQQFPQSDWPYIYYLSSDAVPEVDQLTLGRTTAFVVSSFSTATVLEQHLPAVVDRGLWRIDLRTLNWRWQDWHAILKDYPYRPDLGLPLVIRADWLVVRLSDNFASDAGYRLLYRGAVPKTRDEFLKFWQVSLKGTTDPLLLARVERDEDGNSPSLLDIRRIENRPVANRGYAFGTEDSSPFNFTPETDPLERLVSNRKHDAEEWIVGFPKISIAQGAGGMAQAYLLSNGKGVRQDRAPTEIVTDANSPRGDTAIRNTLGCIICHQTGINPLAKNDLRELIASGVELFADKKSQALIEAQYLADLRMQVEIERAREDYTLFVALSTGFPPAENVRAFQKAFENYDADLTLEDAARELYCSPKELTNALGYASANQVKLGARIAGLVHGRDVQRAYWEQSYPSAFYAVRRWRAVGR